MPLATEGTLATYPLKMSFNQVLVLTAQIMDAVAYMHQKNYTHRDLKPANILLSREGKELKAIVADFGISEQGKTHTSKSGTQGFRAPEVLTELTHDNSVDSWAIGLILWDMLFGATYFVEDLNTEANTINWGMVKARKAIEVKAAKTKTAKVASNKVWLQVADLLRKLLCRTPSERLKVEAARKHPLLRNIASGVATGLSSPRAPAVPAASPTDHIPAVAGPSATPGFTRLDNLRKVSDVSHASDLPFAVASTASKRKREISSLMIPPHEVTALDNSTPNAKRWKGEGRSK
ncbi:hypothetical protein FRB95_006893 [Tulasnella sp. JGI-2019a]|nr:hypothetical protein FRB95_006893 [Tulasnella sp. JGI-2019a]